MAIVDNAFHEWIADFKAANPSAADSRAILDTAQYAFAAGRKAQREIDAARQPDTAHAAYHTGKAIGRREAELEAAARQPVGENPAWRDELVREAYNRGLADGLNADRQPVGQIVGYMDPNADFMLARPGDCVLMGNIVLWREPGSKYTKPLYDAPPAQAVDLAIPIAMIDRALGHLSTALDDLDSSPDPRPGAMVTEAMACLRQALTGVPHG